MPSLKKKQKKREPRGRSHVGFLAKAVFGDRIMPNCNQVLVSWRLTTERNLMLIYKTTHLKRNAAQLWCHGYYFVVQTLTFSLLIFSLFHCGVEKQPNQVQIFKSFHQFLQNSEHPLSSPSKFYLGPFKLH